MLKVPISQFNIPSFENAKTTTKEPLKAISNDRHLSLRMIDIAKERHHDIKSLFSYELSQYNPLFDVDGTLKKEKSKCILTNELVKVLDDCSNSEMTNLISIILTGVTFMIDVMLHCWKIPWNKYVTTFKEFVTNLCS